MKPWSWKVFAFLAVSLVIGGGPVTGSSSYGGDAVITAPISIGQDDNNTSNKVYCKDLHKRNASLQCSFVRSTTDCAIGGGFISYLELPYCHLTEKLEPLAMVLLFLWLLYLFLAIGVTVEHFLCPALAVISNALSLSESVAGVTFLAFGNGAADIFSLFVLIATGDKDPVRAETGMGAILGGGMFVTSVVVGLIAFNYPLQIKLSTFIRDVCFYAAAIAWLIAMLSDGRISKYEALGYIAMYVAYVAVVIAMLKYSQRMERNSLQTPDPNERSALLGGSSERGDSRHHHHDDHGGIEQGSMSGSYSAARFTGSIAGGSVDWKLASDGSILKSQSPQIKQRNHGQAQKQDDTFCQDTDVGASEDSSTSLKRAQSGPTTNAGQSPLKAAEATSAAQGAASGDSGEHGRDSIVSPSSSSSSAAAAAAADSQPTPLLKLFIGLWPYTLADVKSMSILGKVLLVLRLPLRLLLTVTIPVILPTTDAEEANHQWNKYLIALNCLIAPIFGTLAMDVFFHEFADESVLFVGVISCGLGAVLLLLVIIFTGVKKAPVTRPLFAFLGFLMSVVWIYMIANEVVNILDAIGVVLDVNGGFLGLIVLAGGNSVCDLVANFLVAKSGKAEMAVAACYGSPLLNMLIGVGLSATVATFRDDEPFELEYTTQLKVASATLLCGLVFATAFILISRCSCQWKAGRAFAIPLFVLYIAFLVSEIALEFS